MKRSNGVSWITSAMDLTSAVLTCKTSGFLDRSTQDEANWGIRRSKLMANASSQWNAPSWVPITIWFSLTGVSSKLLKTLTLQVNSWFNALLSLRAGVARLLPVHLAHRVPRSRLPCKKELQAYGKSNSNTTKASILSKKCPKLRFVSRMNRCMIILTRPVHKCRNENTGLQSH